MPVLSTEVQRFVTETINTLISWQAYRWLPGLNCSGRGLRRSAGFGPSRMNALTWGVSPTPFVSPRSQQFHQAIASP